MEGEWFGDEMGVNAWRNGGECLMQNWKISKENLQITPIHFGI